MDTMAYANDTTMTYWIGLIGDWETLTPQLRLTGNPWVYALACSALVGLSGLFPVFLLSRGKTNEDRLRLMLAFACGGLLGDVFLHLLPEAYQRLRTSGEEDFHAGALKIGLWILAGFLTFIFVELMFQASEGEVKEDKGDISVSGYLNLAANCIDNFAHGLAVGGAFLVDTKTGLVTTSCILFHEIPHEIGDFAILLKSGFNKYDAARAQVGTAALGVLGAFSALALDSFMAVEAYTAWIVPFTSGGFLHIALVTVLPDLISPEGADGTDKSRAGQVKDSLRVMAGIFVGIAVMFTLSKV